MPTGGCSAGPAYPGDGDAQLAEANLDYRRQVESELLAKINTALGPLLGPDRFHASVNADCDFSSSEENEETVDPTKSAILTSQTTEESSGGATGRRNAGHRVESAAAHGPRGYAELRGLVPPHRECLVPAQPHRETHHFSQRDGAADFDGRARRPDRSLGWGRRQSEENLVPPSAEVLKGVHDIVAGITGFTETRGDQITVETLPFENTLEAEPPPAPPAAPIKQTPPKFDFKQPLVIGGAALLVVLIAGLDFRSAAQASRGLLKTWRRQRSRSGILAARVAPERGPTAKWKSRSRRTTPSRRSSKPKR